MVSAGTAPRLPQTEEGATYDPFLNKKELVRLDPERPAEDIHNFVRGLDSSPGQSRLGGGVLGVPVSSWERQ